MVGGRGPEVRKVGDQTVALVSLGIRPKSGNTNEMSWVLCDLWNHEVVAHTFACNALTTNAWHL